MTSPLALALEKKHIRLVQGQEKVQLKSSQTYLAKIIHISLISKQFGPRLRKKQIDTIMDLNIN